MGRRYYFTTIRKIELLIRNKYYKIIAGVKDMEEKEIEQRIDDVVNEIQLESILQESKGKLEEKLERYDKNRKGLNSSLQGHRFQAYQLGKSKKIKEECIYIGIKCIRVSILIILGLLIYQFLIRPLFS